MNKRIINVAIDGPSGAGKSTIAKMCAKELGFIYVDTGALYRAVAVFAFRNNISTENPSDIVPLLNKIKIELKYQGEVQNVYLNDENVSEEIKRPHISMLASSVSALPLVREFLLDLQKDIAKNNNVIMDGRDIGTVILKDALLKIFLTASVDDRAKRRYDELILKGENVDLAKLKEEIKTRDYNDSHREIAPLKKADDAILVDTSGNELEQSKDIILNLIKDKIQKI